MSDDKKPDRFEERTIKEQIDGFLEAMKHWYNKYPTDIFPDYTLKDNPKPSIDMISAKMARHILSILINEFAPITEALREEAEHATQASSVTSPEIVSHDSKLVSEDELEVLALAHFHGAGCSDPGECNGFKVGFRKAMELRATEDIKARWPSEEEIDSKHEEAKQTEEGMLRQLSFSQGFYCANAWLKEKLFGG